MADTEYQVQLKQVGAIAPVDMGDHPLDAWTDIATVNADNGRAAIRKAVEAQGDAAVRGDYRAIPTRNITEETPEFQTKLVITFKAQAKE